MLPSTNSSSSGQSLVEVVVTTAIAMLILVALVAGATVAVRNIQYSRTRARAMELNRQATEWLRSERAKGWSEFMFNLNFGGNNEAYYCLNNTTDFNFNNPGQCDSLDYLIDSTFKRQVNVVKESQDKIKLTLTTSWTDSQGEHREEVVTYFTRW